MICFSVRCDQWFFWKKKRQLVQSVWNCLFASLFNKTTSTGVKWSIWYDSHGSSCLTIRQKVHVIIVVTYDVCCNLICQDSLLSQFHSRLEASLCMRVVLMRTLCLSRAPVAECKLMTTLPGSRLWDSGNIFGQYIRRVPTEISYSILIFSVYTILRRKDITEIIILHTNNKMQMRWDKRSSKLQEGTVIFYC